MPQRSNRLAITAHALLLVGLIACFWTFRVVLAGSEFPGFGDLLIYYYPHYEATFGAISQGRLPLWNPYQLCGVPWLAALQGGVLYPPHLLYVLLPTHVAMAASSLLHLLLVGVSVAVFARRAGLGGSAVLLAAVLCTMRGRVAGHSGVPNMMEAGAWLAPGAVAVLGLAQGRGLRSVALLALSTAASVLAGYPQYTVYSVYAWGALLALLLLGEGPPLAGWLRAGAGFLGAIALGALVAAAQLLPSFELAAQATRSLGGLSFQEMFPFGPAAGLSLVSAAKAALAGKGEGDLPLTLGFVGLTLLPFALLSRDHRALGLGTLGLGLLVLLFAMGPATPLFDLYLRLPALDSFRIPRRVLLVLDFCFAVAAAVGLDELRRRISRASWGSPRWGELCAALVAMLAVVELFSATPKRPRLPYSGEGYVEVYHRDRELYSELAASGQRVLLWNPGIAPALPPKLASIFGMRSVDDYEPMSLRRQAEYFRFLARGTTEPGGGRPAFFGRLTLPRDAEEARAFASRQRLLDLAAVRFALVPARQARDRALLAYLEAAGLVRSGAPPQSLVLFENPRALPRAFVTHRVRPAPSAEELLAALSRSDFDPLVESYVEGETGLEARAGAAPRGKPLVLVRDEPTRVEVEAELETAGLVVLADSFYPGWRATLDGEPAGIHAANHLFRGVVVPAGRHLVRFDYRPRRVVLGALGSAAGLLVLLLLVWGGGVMRALRRVRRVSRSARAPLLVALAVLVSSGCGRAPEPRDVLLLTLDTTRFDAVGFYEGGKGKTPHLDALARESLRFAQAVTTAPYTGPSHASILTGLYPARHGLRDYLRQSLPDSVDTLSEILQRAGYQTAAFVSTYVLDPRYGLDQGFDVYTSPQRPDGKRRWQRPGGETVSEAIEWLRGRDPERRFFLWVHLYDPHFPYAPPKAYRAPPAPGVRPGSEALQRQRYYEELGYVDAEIGRLLEVLRRLGLYERLIVVVVSDHGELLGEHGRRLSTHSPMLVEATVRVPLLLRVPGRVAPALVEEPVGVVDVFPSVLEALGLELPEGTDGRSLLARRGWEAARALYSETFYEFFPRRAEEGHELASLRQGGWKLVTRPGREELYDLRADPDELRDVSSQHPERVARLREELRRMRSRWPEPAQAEPLELGEQESREHRERLRSLGYVE